MTEICVADVTISDEIGVLPVSTLHADEWNFYTILLDHDHYLVNPIVWYEASPWLLVVGGIAPHGSDRQP